MQEYNKIDQRIHLICQVIAKVNRSLVPKEDDDSHTNLYFDALADRIYGRWFSSDSDRFILFLDLNKQSISIQNQDYKILGDVSIPFKKINKIEEGLKQSLEALGVQSSDLMAPLHFEIPDYSFAEQAIEKFADNNLDLWKHYRSFANNACYTLLGHLQSSSEVRIWPHHFDTGIYTRINQKIAIGFGLAMEGEMVGEPYFYFSVYGLDEHNIDYSNTNTLSKGKWITDDWKGAVLPLHQADKNSLNVFLKETTKWAITN